MLHAITPTTNIEHIITISRQILPFVDAICIRQKEDSITREQLVQKLLLYVPKEKIIINSDIELALKYDLAGVHFTEHDVNLSDFKKQHPAKIVGRSTHRLQTAVHSANEGADYIYFGHVFASPSKFGTSPKGLAALQEVCSTVTIPVMAIGGINDNNMAQVLRAGAKGAAMISTFYSNTNIEQSLHHLQRL